MKVCLHLMFSIVIGLFGLNAQPLVDGKWHHENQYDFGVVVFQNDEEVTYQTSLISIFFQRFSYRLNFRLEDELVSDATYVLLDEVTFLDLQMAYTVNRFQIGFFIENLLGLNDTDFAIEPNLERHLNVADTVYFSHEANFLTGISIAYNF